MTDTDTDLLESYFDLDHICWNLTYSLIDHEHWLWLDELEGYEDYTFDDEYDRGYAHGVFQQTIETAQHLGTEGIDVFARAKRYRDENDVDLRPVWLDDVDDGLEIDLHDTRADDPGPGQHFTSVPDERLEAWKEQVEEQDEEDD